MAMAPINPPETHPATQLPHMPHELVSSILARLPIGLLLRLRRVCKAWRDTISGDDPSFARAHLRHQQQRKEDIPWLLVAPEIRSQACDNRGRCSMYAGWYRWPWELQPRLVYAPDSPWLVSKGELVHRFAHCDGLVLVPAETTVRVLNPATRRVLELPPLSPSCREVPAEEPPAPGGFYYRHQTFGLGHDPRSGTYKVVRLFYRSDLDVHTERIGSLGVEVFTIGVDEHWREIAAQPPYPAIAGWTATYSKGFLFWIIDDYRWGHKDDDEAATRGLVCFSLEDESFSVMPTPVRVDSSCILAELDGKLCVAHLGINGESLELWMCTVDFVGGVNPPSWCRSYINTLTFPHQLGSFPLVAFRGGKNLECALSQGIFSYDAHTGKCEGSVQTEDFRFQDPAKDKGTFIVERVFSLNVIPYIPSLVPI